MISLVESLLKPDTVLAANEESATQIKHADVTLNSDAEGGDFDLFVAVGENRKINNLSNCNTIVLMDTNNRANRLNPIEVGKFKAAGYEILYVDNNTVMTKDSELVDRLEKREARSRRKPPKKEKQVTIQPVVPFVGTTLPPEVVAPRPPKKTKRGKKDES